MFRPTAPGRGAWKRVLRNRIRPSSAATAAVTPAAAESRSHRERPGSSQCKDGDELPTVADDIEGDDGDGPAFEVEDPPAELLGLPGDQCESERDQRRPSAGRHGDDAADQKRDAQG